ncbi:response regulator [Mastigocladopsis repens]|uniref:response regulator n=1 Tax=Mastigocladopsis repens TaxID=221287 RepID=UPI0003111742|nr:response regulator [Mastigocladopsis repens]
MSDKFLKLDGLRLLVVDDDADARELLTCLFSWEGAEIITATSAVEALDALAGFQPDILISDIRLPDEDGYSLLLKVRNLDVSQGGKIPAIALTADAGEEYRIRALSAGFDRYIAKPIDLDELSSVVKSLAFSKISKISESDKLNA